MIFAGKIDLRSMSPCSILQLFHKCIFCVIRYYSFVITPALTLANCFSICFLIQFVQTICIFKLDLFTNKIAKKKRVANSLLLDDHWLMD